jgi:hypothetical protein
VLIWRCCVAGALNATRLEQILARFRSFSLDDTSMPPFHYGKKICSCCWRMTFRV